MLRHGNTKRSIEVILRKFLVEGPSIYFFQ